jgi:hypothetical protein
VIQELGAEQAEHMLSKTTNHRYIKRGLDNVARPFLVGPVGSEGALQQVWRDVEGTYRAGPRRGAFARMPLS